MHKIKLSIIKLIHHEKKTKTLDITIVASICEVKVLLYRFKSRLEITEFGLRFCKRGLQHINSEEEREGERKIGLGALSKLESGYLGETSNPKLIMDQVFWMALTFETQAGGHIYCLTESLNSQHQVQSPGEYCHRK